MNTNTVRSIIQQGKTIREALGQIGGKLPEEFEQPLAVAITEAEASVADLARINMERSATVQLKQARADKVADLVKRIRGGVLSAFGDDSTEYHLVGMKRRSDRKRPAARKAEVTPSK